MNKRLNSESPILPLSQLARSPLPTGAARDAVEVLGRRIANDTYSQGKPIPTEPELAQSLGVGRATIRDAIKVLSGKGMIRTARRYGTKVRPIEEWNLLDADVISWHDIAHPRVRQMYAETTELRCIIEPEASALAAERATPEQVQSICDAANAMDLDEGDINQLFLADCKFHSTILDATDNLMVRQLRPIFVSILRMAYEFGGLVAPEEPVSREGHIKVADAIREGDGARARAEMKKMLDNNRRTAEQNWHAFGERTRSK